MKFKMATRTTSSFSLWLPLHNTILCSCRLANTDRLTYRPCHSTGVFTYGRITAAHKSINHIRQVTWMCIPVYYMVLRDHTGLSPPTHKSVNGLFSSTTPPPKKFRNFPKFLWVRVSFSSALYGDPQGSSGIKFWQLYHSPLSRKKNPKFRRKSMIFDLRKKSQDQKSCVDKNGKNVTIQTHGFY